ncbi:MAG: hypothetical protein AB8I08_19485 [Sandaracinaceae bacterium]
MAQKKRRKRKRKPSAARRARGQDDGDLGVPVTQREESGGGGVMQSIRSGFQRAAGAGETVEEKPSTASNVIWGLVLLGAVAFLLYRWYG